MIRRFVGAAGEVGVGPIGAIEQRRPVMPARVVGVQEAGGLGNTAALV
jgi:hypothetical protein